MKTVGLAPSKSIILHMDFYQESFLFYIKRGNSTQKHTSPPASLYFLICVAPLSKQKVFMPVRSLDFQPAVSSEAAGRSAPSLSRKGCSQCVWHRSGRDLSKAAQFTGCLSRNGGEGVILTTNGSRISCICMSHSSPHSGAEDLLV